MKIKKFRIKPRLPSVGKVLKGLLSIKQLPLEIEQTLPQEAEQFVTRIIPTAFYSTWKNDERPMIFSPHMDAALLKDAVAVSVVVATIGEGAEELLAEALVQAETTRTQVITALCEESADLSFNFIARLLAEDAEHDGCELSPAMLVTDVGSIEQILPLLESSHDEVRVDQAQHLTPRFTRVALFAWIPIKKRKREPALAQKKTA